MSAPADRPLAGAEEPEVRRFERVAAQSPGAIALESAGGELSYRELDQQANRLAHRLIARGVAPGSVVAVCLPTSPDLIIAMLAIWKAGGVYLPLDPSHPGARLALIIDETRPQLLLTSREHDEKTAFHGVPQEHLEAANEPTGGRSEAPPGIPVSPAQAAYLFYTSGTTGAPKGVVASHGNLSFYTRAARDRYGFSGSDTFCSLARPTFSISLFELLSPLLCGGRLLLLDRPQILDPERLAAALRQVTVLHAGPSLLGYFLRYLETIPPADRVFSGVRHASSGGDMIPPGLLERMKPVFPRAELFVIYGCTEISCLGCTFPVPRDLVLQRTLIGSPFPGVSVRLIDHGRPVSPGEVGEIHVAGPGVTQGYRGRPEQGRFCQIDGERHYATGDLARLDPSGALEILGRADDQVKIHGVRVELGEIEQALRRAPGVREAVVAAWARGEQEKSLVAYVVGDQLAEATQELRAFLRGQLPEDLVPADFVVLDRLPLNHNLKVDRRALPAPGPPGATGDRGAPLPSDHEIEAHVGRVFARFLGLDRVSAGGHFFDLGGSSLLALRVTEQLNQERSLSLPPWTLFQCPTVALVARQIRAGTPLDRRPVALNGNTRGPTLFLLAAVQAYRDLARELEPEASVQAISVDRQPQAGEEHAPPWRLEDLAAEYVAALQLAQPRGSYRLAGYSFGGVLAYEVAQQLRRQGREVTHLWLLDSVLPAHRHSWVRVARRLLALGPGPLVETAAREAQKSLHNHIEQRSQPPPEFADDPVRAMDERRTEAYLAATRSYMRRIRPYEGPATLLVATRRLAESFLLDPQCGWSPHIQRLRVEPIDAGHYDLLSGRQLPRVASAFRRVIGPGGPR